MTSLQEDILVNHFQTKEIYENKIITEVNVKLEGPKKKNRCSFPNCKKKLKMTDVKCRCMNIYCPIHRLPESHHCDFDHKSLGKDLLQKTLTKVTHEKIQKI